MKDIVLASASPRRSQLLKQIGLDFRVLTSDVDETIDKTISAEEAVKYLSVKKASDVSGKIAKGPLIIGADTVVVKDVILGKPRDEEEAFSMLKSLQNQWHEVITGITVIDTSTGKVISDFEKTRVKMRSLSDSMIHSYINTKEPFDKAGAYGIQGMGAILVERLEGCYFNVVGLPLTKLTMILELFEVKVM